MQSKRVSAPTSPGARQSSPRTVADDWLPPKLVRGVRRVRAGRASAPPAPRPVSDPTPEPVVRHPRWEELTRRTLAGLETCEAIYRPTNFWTPGVQRLLADMDERGIEVFKSWPQAFFWFYPVHGKRIRPALRRRLLRIAENGPNGTQAWVRALLHGTSDARRDFDVARMAWDQSRWPMDLESHGESQVGRPTQVFKLGQTEGLTKPYLNYLLCLAALSRHVERPPKSFLELGGGFGVLGEIVMSRDPEVRYVNCDIPPLLTVSSYYLSELFGDDRVLTYDDRVPDHGPIEVPQSACLPNWRIGDVVGDFEVFVNSYSFQEMEPQVVEAYVTAVASLGVDYVLSLNSKQGKPIQTDEQGVGVREQVTSPKIIRLFEDRGYELCATYDSPLVHGAGQIAVLKRR